MKYNDSTDDPAPMMDLGAETGSWHADVDYFSGWRESQQAAELLRIALASAGLEHWECRPVADVAENGAPLVRLVATCSGATRLAHLLDAAAHTGLTADTA